MKQNKAIGTWLCVLSARKRQVDGGQAEQEHICAFLWKVDDIFIVNQNASC